MKQDRPAYNTTALPSASKNAAPHEATGSSSWPELLPELLALILMRVWSHAGRVRFRAVCRSWTSAVQPGDLPPLLPWVALRDGAFLSLPEGTLHHLPISADVSHRVSAGEALFTVRGDSSCYLTNPLTGDTTAQHILWSDMGIRSTQNVRKVILAADHIVAAIGISSGTVGICCSGGACVECEMSANDIVLFKGKLYLLTSRHSPNRLHRELHAMDYSSVTDNMRAPALQCVIPATTDIPGTTKNTWPIVTYKRYYYLIVSGDRLLMVEREVEMQLFGGVPSHTRRLEVFEATGLLDGPGHARWTKLDTLTGHALFISLDGSWSLPVAGNYGRVVGAVLEDCVYFLSEHRLDPRSDRKPEDDFRNCGVYNIRDQTMSPLPMEVASVLASHGGPWSLTWFFLRQI